MPLVQKVGTTIGYGTAHGHHGEVLQGMFFGNDGCLYRGLVTLPWKNMLCKAKFIVDGRLEVEVYPKDRTKARKAAETVSQSLIGRVIGGTLQLDSTLLIGRGIGSSTSDVVATILAVADCLQVNLSSYDVARFAVKAEVASDAIMFPHHSVLFAQREGIVLKHFEGPFPAMYIVGVDAPTQEAIDTLEMKPITYTMQEIEEFRILLSLLAYGIQYQDASLVGRVATASAIINQRYVPKPNFDVFMTISQETEAVGIQVAHSGTVLGIMYDAINPFVEQRVTEAKRRLTRIGLEPYEIVI